MIVSKIMFQQEGTMPLHLNPDGNTTSPQPPEPAGTNPSVEHAIAERERFLQRCPHLRAYQQEIDGILDKSGTSHNRMAVLATLIQGKLLDIQKELYKAALVFKEQIISHRYPQPAHRQYQPPDAL
jgi:hypothetical protein